MEQGTHETGTGETTHDSYQRILEVAEQLYMERGYRAVSLRDIANALAIKQASLYYHFPEGKEQLFQAVVERALRRHQAGIEAIVTKERPHLRQQLLDVVAWFNSQPPLNFTAMTHTDMPALQPERMKALERSAYISLFHPIMRIFTGAMERGEIRQSNPAMLAGTVIAILSGLNYGLRQVEENRRAQMIDDIVDLLLEGLYPR